MQEDRAVVGIARNVLYDFANYEGVVSHESEEYARLGCRRRPYKKVAITSDEKDDKSLNLLCLRVGKNLLSVLAIGKIFPTLPSAAQLALGAVLVSRYLRGDTTAAGLLYHNLLLYRDDKDIFIIDPVGDVMGKKVHPLSTELKSVDEGYTIHDASIPILSTGGSARCGKISALCADRIEYLVKSKITVDGIERSFDELRVADKSNLIKAYLGIYIESPDRMEAHYRLMDDRIKNMAVNGQTIDSIYTTQRPLFFVEKREDRPYFVNSLTAAHIKDYDRSNGLGYDPTLPHLETFHDGRHVNDFRQQNTLVPLLFQEEVMPTFRFYVHERGVIAGQTEDYFATMRDRAAEAPTPRVARPVVRRAGESVGRCAIL